MTQQPERPTKEAAVRFSLAVVCANPKMTLKAIG